MSDLISRRMMLDKMISRKSLFSTNQYEYTALSEVDKARADEIDNCIADLRNVPDAESEQKKGRKFLGIVVNYPKICTYPEYEGKPYYSIKYEENGDMIVGFGTYKSEVLSQYLREYFISPAETERKKGEWIEINGTSSFMWLRCSECGYGFNYRTNFCPYCGAEMNRGDR